MFLLFYYVTVSCHYCVVLRCTYILILHISLCWLCLYNNNKMVTLPFGNILLLLPKQLKSSGFWP